MIYLKLSEQQVLAIKRKRGELDYTIKDLAKATGVNRWTLIDVFKHDHRHVTSTTFKKLNDWLIAEYTNIPTTQGMNSRKEVKQDGQTNTV